MLRDEQSDDPKGGVDGKQGGCWPSPDASGCTVCDYPGALAGQSVAGPRNQNIYPRPHLSLSRGGHRRRCRRDEENHRGAQNCADMATAGMKCPQCGSRHVVSNITIRWNQVKGSFLSERGHFCFRCGRPFQNALHGDFGFRSMRVPAATPAMHSLQSSGDVVVVRYRNGATEILF